jgi:hypothetical protein
MLVCTFSQARLDTGGKQQSGIPGIVDSAQLGIDAQAPVFAHQIERCQIESRRHFHRRTLDFVRRRLLRRRWRRACGNEEHQTEGDSLFSHLSHLKPGLQHRCDPSGED